MSYARKRIEYNNKWTDEIIKFSGQEFIYSFLNNKGMKHIFRPIKLPLIDDFQFQRLLSFKIDIYEQLPNRSDIAFDNIALRTFEAYSAYFAKERNWNTTKTWRILNKSSEDILLYQFNNNSHLSSAFSNLINAIPLQALEFLIKRSFDITTTSLKYQQNHIIERVIDSLGKDLFNNFKEKYGDLTPDSQRKAALLLQMMISMIKVNIGSKYYQLDKLQIIKFLINGLLLYTYRNERFHGDVFSSFKRSKTKIKTFANSYFCLIITYFFIS